MRTRRLIGTATVTIALAVTSSPAAAFTDKDCSDFDTQHQAQRYFKNHGGPRHDPSRLDTDHDGKACEDLP